MEQKTEYIKLDYSIKDINERKEIVNKILNSNKNLSPQYLDILSDYLVLPVEKTEKKEKKILTDNRLVTVNKRETSYQGLVSKLENGEDGLYHMMGDNSKNVILTPKVSITQHDLDTIPELRELRDSIEHIKILEKEATGKRKYQLKRQIIEMCQDQYVIKNAYQSPVYAQNPTKSTSSIDLSETFYIDAAGDIKSDGLVTLLNPDHISALLCNYSLIKQEVDGKVSSDLNDIMTELDKLIDQTLKKDYPLYYDLLWYKIDGMRNIDIRAALDQKHGITYTVEYLSQLWRKKIPKLLAEQAEENYLLWYYTIIEKGKWKKCSRCGEIKLAHSKFFSRNKTSSDGFYSVCKCCRNKKRK